MDEKKIDYIAEIDKIENIAFARILLQQIFKTVEGKEFLKKKLDIIYSEMKDIEDRILKNATYSILYFFIFLLFYKSKIQSMTIADISFSDINPIKYSFPIAILYFNLILVSSTAKREKLGYYKLLIEEVFTPILKDSREIVTMMSEIDNFSINNLTLSDHRKILLGRNHEISRTLFSFLFFGIMMSGTIATFFSLYSYLQNIRSLYTLYIIPIVICFFFIYLIFYKIVEKHLILRGETLIKDDKLKTATEMLKTEYEKVLVANNKKK